MSDNTKLEADIFAAVMAIDDVHQRAALVEIACRNDPELHQRVKQLMAAARGVPISSWSNRM